MKQMDTTTNIIFRSLTAIYSGTISGDSLYPALYFLETEKPSTYYGFRLHEVIPTRLIARIYEEGKKTITDLLWLVDNAKIHFKNHALFRIKSNEFQIEGESRPYISMIRNDATITACYGDLLAIPDFFDMVIIGTPEWAPSKLLSETKLNIQNIPTKLYGFSRTILSTKEMTDEHYQDEAINSYLALIDLVHRSFELMSQHSQKKNGDIAFCVRCGQELSSSAVYCPICGSKQN